MKRFAMSTPDSIPNQLFCSRLNMSSKQFALPVVSASSISYFEFFHRKHPFWLIHEKNRKEKDLLLHVGEGDQATQPGSEAFLYIYSSAGYDTRERLDLGTEGVYWIESSKAFLLRLSSSKAPLLFYVRVRRKSRQPCPPYSKGIEEDSNSYFHPQPQQIL